MILYRLGELYLENEIEKDEDTYEIEGSEKVKSLDNLFKIEMKFCEEIEGIDSYYMPDYHFEFLIHSKAGCDNLMKAVQRYIGQAGIRKLLNCEYLSLTVSTVDDNKSMYLLSGNEVYVNKKPEIYKYIKEFIEL